MGLFDLKLLNVGAMLLLLVISGCSNSGYHLVGPEAADTNVTVKSIASSTSFRPVTVIYREKDASDLSVLVRANNRIVGGLLPRQYLVTEVCVGDNVFDIQLINKEHLQFTFTSKLEQKQFLKLYLHADGTPKLITVADDVANKAIAELSYRSYLVNRGAFPCDDLKTVEAKPTANPVESKPIAKPLPISKEIKHASTVLFKFNGATLQELSPETELNKIITQIEDFDMIIDRIVVAGYTDRVGNKLNHQKLSEQRAKSVVNFLLENGVKGEISSVGFGSSSPVTDGCFDKKNRAELISCLQPDRRVIIQLWGHKTDSAVDGNH